MKAGAIHFRYQPVKGADAETFRCYAGGYTRDKKAVYIHGNKLKGADPATLVPLSYTYFKDAAAVYGMGIRMPDADPATFEACDSGTYYVIPTTPVPYGYGKDANAVFYFSFDGKPKPVKKADPKTFVSCGDGVYGKDAANVFLGLTAIPKADPATWAPLAGLFSKDADRVFFKREVLKAADPTTFEVLSAGRNATHAARDAATCYVHELAVPEATYAKVASGELLWASVEA